MRHARLLGARRGGDSPLGARRGFPHGSIQELFVDGPRSSSAESHASVSSRAPSWLEAVAFRTGVVALWFATSASKRAAALVTMSESQPSFVMRIN